MLRYLGQVFRTENLEEIGLSGQESRQRSVEIRSNAPDHSAKLRSAAIIRAVCHYFHRSTRCPPHEPELPRSNGMLCRIGCPPCCWWNILPDVLRHYWHLVYGVEELLRVTRVEPEHRCRGIRRADGIDVRDERGNGRAESRISGAAESESHIVGV